MVGGRSFDGRLCQNCTSPRRPYARGQLNKPSISQRNGGPAFTTLPPELALSISHSVAMIFAMSFAFNTPNISAMLLLAGVV